MNCKSVTYNKPSIPKGTRGKFCLSHLLHVDNQIVTPYRHLAILGFFTLFYALVSVYLGIFWLF